MRKKHLVALAVLEVVLILVLLPRFDRRDIGVLKQITSSGMEGKVFNDSQAYVQYVDWYRAIDDGSRVAAPYVFRPALPFIA